MTYKYSAIKLSDESKDYVDDRGKQCLEIDGLSGINIFVGENNSGKSRFLRELAKIEQVKFKRKGLDIDSLKAELDSLSKGINEIVNKHKGIVSFCTKGSGVGGALSIERGDMNIKPYYENFMYFPTIPADSEDDKPHMKNIYKLKSFLGRLKDGDFHTFSFRFGNKYLPFQTELQKYLKDNEKILLSLNEFIFETIKFKKYYIPVLRSLNCFDKYKSDVVLKSDVDIYSDRIQEIYKLGRTEIFTGQKLYEKVNSMQRGSTLEKKNIKIFENYLAKEVFNVEEGEVILTPTYNKDVLHIKIGNDEERPIYDLGDGIQSLIIYIFPLFECENGIFFIEEPETHLHPGMQRKFIEIIRKIGKERNHQYFITTHSNHLLDLTLDFDDISVYTFKKIKDDKKVINQVSSGDKSTLQLLGVQSSSVFLSNSTIWVEGITDRWYIRKFLELYQTENKLPKIQEDIDYSFVEYGGGNITHWSFLDKEDEPINVERLCSTLFLITDKDGDSKMERKEQLKKNLGDRYKLLDCNEIENVLSLKTLEKVIKKYENNEKFKMPSFTIDYPHKGVMIGDFVESEIFKTQEIKRKGGYKIESGTIKSKKDFCQKATEDMRYEEMSPLAIELAKQIYDFVNSIKNNTAE